MANALKNFKSYTRGISINDIEYPLANSLPFLQSENGNHTVLFALEVLFNLPQNYSEVLNCFWGNKCNNIINWAIEAEKYHCDFLALKFNINCLDEVDGAVGSFSEILKVTKKTLIVTGTNKKELDTILLPKLVKAANRPCIFGIAEQDSYKYISELITSSEHYIIARTPIDINLAKELNILLCDSGISPDKILIDTNMASLGYGLDYGYSIMERVKLAGLGGDDMLNMPIIAFAGEEAWKSKESRTDNYDSNYGLLSERAIAWESATATAVMLAGANIVTLWHPETIKGLYEFMGRK